MNSSSPPKHLLDRERLDILQQLEDWFDLPMVVLGFVWLGLFVIELVQGLTPFLEAVGLAIWSLFVVNFALEFILAPRKRVYLRQNWLTVLSLLLPALRVLRIARFLRLLRSTSVVRGLKLLRFLTRTNRGMRALAASMSRRGFGYVVTLTLVITLVGAAGMYTFEKDIAGDTGLHSYSAALWWTAMLMTTMGSEYWPQSPEGRVLCLLLALYAFAVFGYVTAVLATFFVGRDADDKEAELASAQSITALQSEIRALRTELQALAQQFPNQ
jgi:voltage-gated potassium channel